MGMLGETLVGKGIISQAKLDQALGEQKKTGEKLGDLLVRLGFVTREQVETALK
jgi:type IV pilus assembly protein PilB